MFISQHCVLVSNASNSLIFKAYAQATSFPGSLQGDGKRRDPGNEVDAQDGEAEISNKINRSKHYVLYCSLVWTLCDYDELFQQKTNQIKF